MFNYFLQLLSLFKTFFAFVLFSYIYKKLYASCSEKKIIKTKEEKNKKVIKTRIGLAFLYLGLLTALYLSLTWYVVLTLLVFSVIIFLVLTKKFQPKSLDVIKKYDNHSVSKKLWFYFSLFLGFVFKMMAPFHIFIENKIKTNCEFIYAQAFESFVKSNMFSLDSLFSNMDLNKLTLPNLNLKNNSQKQNAQIDFDELMNLNMNLNNGILNNKHFMDNLEQTNLHDDNSSSNKLKDD